MEDYRSREVQDSDYLSPSVQGRCAGANRLSMNRAYTDHTVAFVESTSLHVHEGSISELWFATSGYLEWDRGKWRRL